MPHVNLSHGEWVGLSQTFLSYFYVSYCDIGVLCKLLPPCQGERPSLLAVFLKVILAEKLPIL